MSARKDAKPVMTLVFHRATYDKGGYALLCTDAEGSPVLVYVRPADVCYRPQKMGRYRFTMSKRRAPAPYDAVMSSFAAEVDDAGKTTGHWETIDNSKVRHIWKMNCSCNDEAGPDDEKVEEVATVSPDSYEESGEPSCPLCDTLYRYSHTEVLR